MGVEEARERRGGVSDRVGVGEEGGGLPVVGVGEAGLDPVEEVEDAVGPGPVGVGEGEFDDAGGPLRVGHLLEVAEVGFRGRVEGGDELVLAGEDRLGVAAELVDEARGAGRGVLDLVHVGVEVGQARGHPALHLPAADPALALDAGGVDEEALDLRGCPRFEGRHRGGADEDGIDGHARAPVGEGPGAAEVGDRVLRAADAAADGEDDVRGRADAGVGREEEVVEVLPGVVPAGVAVLDLEDELDPGVRVGDVEGAPDLLDGAGLEAEVFESVGAQARDELCRLVEVGDARGDRHRVDRRAGAAGLRDDPGRAELEVPHEAVEEHRVESGGAARFEEALEALAVVREDLLGVLAPARHLRPVAGVRGGGDDLGGDGRRGHAGQEDRRPAGEAREGGVGVDGAVGEADEARREGLP